MPRTPMPGHIQDQVLLLSRRRCCVCFGLSGNFELKVGQIAHLDHDNQNHALENLAWLCFEHHNEYDSKTSQSKGLRESEVKKFRSDLYNLVKAGLLRAEKTFLQVFGGEHNDTQELANWFQRLQTTALTQTSSVQCLGMKTPLPFDTIYQPTRVIVAHDEQDNEGEVYAWDDRMSRSILRDRALKQKTITTQEFLRRDHDGVILGGPGWGKTTFLRHIYRTEIQKHDVLPVLITLRRPTAVEDLEKFVKACTSLQKNQRKAYTLLLVDGYDEVSKEQRSRVSEALLHYQTLRTGKFYLTCREYYELPQFNAPEVRLGAFTRDDQVRFVRVFLSRFATVKLDAEVVVKELEDRGFEEFLEHPLLLTLACIVRTSSTSVQPRSTLRLLQRALDVLCFQWDEQKNIDRQPSTPLDGRDRVTILKNIALTAKSTYVLRPRAEEITRKQLTLMGMDKVDPQQALLEIARFYGILVPAEDGYEFVHRTLHDYLAAQQWVESGEFARQQKLEWNSRTAYAACLIQDGTQVLKDALAAPDGLPAITEIIANHASFQMRPIADALIDYFSAPGRVVVHERRTHDEASSKYSPRVTGCLDSDFVRLANTRFLDFIVEYCCDKSSRSTDLLVTYAAVELFKRREKLMHQTYNKALQAYKTDTFTFAIVGASQTQLQFLNPVLQNRLKILSPPQTE